MSAGKNPLECEVCPQVISNNILMEKVGVKNVLQQVCMCQILKKAFIKLSKVKIDSNITTA